MSPGFQPSSYQTQSDSYQGYPQQMYQQPTGFTPVQQPISYPEQTPSYQQPYYPPQPTIFQPQQQPAFDLPQQQQQQDSYTWLDEQDNLATNFPLQPEGESKSDAAARLKAVSGMGQQDLLAHRMGPPAIPPRLEPLPEESPFFCSNLS